MQQDTSRFHGLDTLRALAIVSVMFFHLRYLLPNAVQSAAQFGWIGVDLFFVLSGYLIGSQLLKPYLRGEKPSLIDFYRRRAYRILPAYLTVLALYSCVPVWREAPGISPLWQFLTSTLNFFIDYSRNQAFSHAWSLCVEEHFYLVLPVLVLWAMRKPSLRKTIMLLVSFTLAGIGLRAYTLLFVLRPMVASDSFAVTYLQRIYYPTFTHLDGLVAGVALALIRFFRPVWWSFFGKRGHASLWSGAFLVGTSLLLFTDRFVSVTGAAAAGILVGYPVLSLGLGLLVASSVSENGLLSRVRVPGAKIVAILAFSLYLTHKEIVHLDSLFFGDLSQITAWKLIPLIIGSCFLGAGLLYLCVERPFLLLRERREGSRRIDVDREAQVEPAL